MVQQLYQSCTSELKTLLAAVPSLAIAMDIWSVREVGTSDVLSWDQGGHSHCHFQKSYLGATAKVMVVEDDRESGVRSARIVTVVLACLRLEGRHTGIYVKLRIDEILAAWGIPWDKIKRFLTDGGTAVPYS